MRIGVIGCGSMGGHHARTVAANASAVLVGVVDPHEERREAVAAAHAVSSYADVSSLLAAGIDAAVIAAPTAKHHALATLLLSSGVHVLVEKPIAGGVDEARDLVALAEGCGRKLMIGHVERFNPALVALRAALQGEDVRSVVITRASPFPARIGDVGIVLDLAVHDIDLIRWMASSEIAEHQAQVSQTRGAHEDSALLQFRTTSGAIASINTNWLTPFRQRRMEVATPDRFFVCDMLQRTLTVFSDYGKDGSFRQRALFVPASDPLAAEHAAFYAAVRGEAEVPVSGHDGLRSLEIALACLGRAGGAGVRGASGV
ncbi:dehydrogenase [Aureimonas sp. SA4125]|nr:dehydrogenase [Aureimonas sp. SA4125]